MEIARDWTFRSAEVAADFDRHVREQLPWYDIVSGAIVHFARHYIPRDGRVYDVGASTGNLGRLLEGTIRTRNAVFTAIEESPEMAAKYAAPIDEKNFYLDVENALGYEFAEFDLAVCNLVLMFFPPERRRKWLLDLVGKCRTGGAVIVVDLLENPGGYYGTALARLRLAGKLAAGAEPQEIIAKELSLAGAQRPLEASFVEFAVPGGAKKFFQFGEFAGWVIESPRR